MTGPPIRNVALLLLLVIVLAMGWLFSRTEEKGTAPPSSPNSQPAEKAVKAPTLVARSMHAMGTRFDCTVAAIGAKSDVEAAIDAAFSEVKRVEALMTVHQEESYLSQVNAQAGKAAVSVPDELHAATRRKVQMKSLYITCCNTKALWLDPKHDNIRTTSCHRIAIDGKSEQVWARQISATSRGSGMSSASRIDRMRSLASRCSVSSTTG